MKDNSDNENETIDQLEIPVNIEIQDDSNLPDIDIKTEMQVEKEVPIPRSDPTDGDIIPQKSYPAYCTLCKVSGAKYLSFFSPRSLKMREKYISFAQLVLLSLYIFCRNCVYFSIFE